MNGRGEGAFGPRAQRPDAPLSILADGANGAQVPPIISFGLHRRFQDKNFSPQSRIVDDAAESIQADSPFANVLVAVAVRTQLLAGIVGVDHRNTVEPHSSIQ